MIETYKNLYNERFLDIEKKIKYLEDRKKKTEEVESNGGNAMLKYLIPLISLIDFKFAEEAVAVVVVVITAMMRTRNSKMLSQKL